MTEPSPQLTAMVALTGNPNCGKTTLFNALTGLRGRVGNYPGVTVERKEGQMLSAPADLSVTILDLPGTYSLSPQSLDEQIARDVLLERLPEVPVPDLVVVVVDASNLERNLYYATQVIELGYPTLLALNMLDVAEANGAVVDAGVLSERLGVPVIGMVASAGEGLKELREAIVTLVRTRPSVVPLDFLVSLPESAAAAVRGVVATSGVGFGPTVVPRPMAVAALALADDKGLAALGDGERVRQSVEEGRRAMERAGVDWRSVFVEARYAGISGICEAVLQFPEVVGETFSDRVDRVVTHKVWGMVLFVVIMGVLFQSIFVLAQYPMDLIEGGVGWLGEWVGGLLGPGDLRSLLVDGVVAGVGSVVVFLPQICLLFLFIGLLEDTGYMARAAFLMDRLMSRVGLHGKSFIPMLSSFACAIPGIMATRTIESPKDRLVTMLVAPLMSCSARLPVYAVLIAACVPAQTYFGVVKLQGMVLLGMYLLGIVGALGMAWVFKKTLLKGATPLLIMELPPYRRPVLSAVLRQMWERSKLFLRRAGTVILAISVVLWFLVTYPRGVEAEGEAEGRREAAVEAARAATPDPQAQAAAVAAVEAAFDNEAAGERLRGSFAGRLGHWIEPVLAPLGFDWKIGIGIVASFAAREVFVSTMSTVYNVGQFDDSDEGTQGLAAILQEQRRGDGRLVYTPLVGVSLMVFYVFALQCVSTVAVMRRETNSWKWPVFQWFYMGVLAWVASFVVYQGGRALGF